MSKSLVRTSLTLFGYEKNLKKDTKKRRKNKSKGALDLIPINHRIIAKKNNKEIINLGRSGKTSVNEAKKRLDGKLDPTEDTVRRLLLLSGSVIDAETSKKLLGKALDGSYIADKEKPETPQATVFTEEDFANFEREYREL